MINQKEWEINQLKNRIEVLSDFIKRTWKDITDLEEHLSWMTHDPQYVTDHQKQLDWYYSLADKYERLRDKAEIRFMELHGDAK